MQQLKKTKQKKHAAHHASTSLTIHFKVQLELQWCSPVGAGQIKIKMKQHP